MSSASVLTVKNLSTHFYTRYGVIKAVDGASFTVAAGKTLGLVGESGCGKSVTALSILRLIEPPGRICSGEVWLNGYDLLRLPSRQLRQVRGREIALVFQDPLTSLNPVLTIGTQLAETIVSHQETTWAEARQRAVELLARMGLPDPERLMRLYPFQLSGGMRQRVMMAMALSLRPKVLIADEPTTALDVTLQAQILAELKQLQEELGMAIILITHDLGVVAAMADEVAVMYAGSIVERGPVAEVFDRPAHPYTRALLRSVPRLDREELVPVEGQPPSLLNLPAHCAFLPRCPQAGAECWGDKPGSREIGPGHTAACHRFSWSRLREAGCG
ncbi:MAG: ABC transporter ATP-binding protein [Firmicutes bacterium]|nr:ABC transporter ATP-binding protein [Bacillota bacterium]